MKLTKLDIDISSVNTAEATFGDVCLLGNSLVVPYFNVHITKAKISCNFSQYEGHFFNFCYLSFDFVETITWSYDLSRFIESSKRECYGGNHHFSNEYKEFWISYRSASIYVPDDFSKSTSPFEEDDFSLERFLSISKVDRSLFSSGQCSR